jgi:sec-independent protein translocase protein TatA
MDVGVPELLIIFFVVLLVFGSTRVPKLARSLGEAVREFRGAVTTDDDTGAKPDPPAS